MYGVEVVRRKYGLPKLSRLRTADVHLARAPNSHPLVQAAVVREEAQGRALRIARQESSAAILTESSARSRSTHLRLCGRCTRHKQCVSIHVKRCLWIGRANAHVSFGFNNRGRYQIGRSIKLRQKIIGVGCDGGRRGLRGTLGSLRV